MKGRKINSFLQRICSLCNCGNHCQAATLLLSFIIPTFFSSCAVDTQNEIDENIIKVEFKSPGASNIEHLDLFFFNDDTLRRLDSYQKFDNISLNSVEGGSRKGNKIVVAVANYPGEFKWENSYSYNKLRSVLCNLADEDPSSPIMSGESHVQCGYVNNCQLTLEPLLAQIHINSICCDFHNRPYSADILENVKLYLTNVNSKCEMLRQDEFKPIDILNNGRLNEAQVSKLAFPEMIYQELETAVGENVISPNINLYCYPNDTEEEGLGSPYTRLVIEGEIGGTTYYYPININEDGFGYAEGGKGINRDIRYSLDITITRKGSTDPDIPVETGTADIVCSILRWDEKDKATVTFHLPSKAMATNSIDPDETRISDINLFVINSSGELDEHKFLKGAALITDSDEISFSTKVLKNASYSYYVCANMGYSIQGIKNVDDLRNYRYYMTYPDEYKEGMPMSGSVKDITIEDDKQISIPLVRMMSKISLNVDRTALDAGVRFLIRSVRIGGCPSSALPFGTSRARSADEIFKSGFVKSGMQTDILNRDISPGLSGDISLYMMENMQGNLLSGTITDQGKVFPQEDTHKDICSFIELKSEYYSNDFHTRPGEYLIYRFYLGNGLDNFDIERNCHYHVTLRPEGTGITENSWRVDKSALSPVYNGPIVFKLHPGNYIAGTNNEKVHIWCDVYPPDTQFSISKEDLEFDKERGIYDYEMDPDGFGVVLTLKNNGSGLINIDAGPPINDGFLVVVVVNP